MIKFEFFNDAIVDISTGHVTEEDCEKLNACKLDNYNYEYGWIVHLTPETFKLMVQHNMSAAFVDLCHRVLNEERYWIKFDGDGPHVEGLPTYDW